MTDEGAEVRLDIRIENQRGPARLPDPPANDPDAMLSQEIEALRAETAA